MDSIVDQQFLVDSFNGTKLLSAELNKKRKLENELNDLCSPVSKQKIHNQELMEEEQEQEEEDSSENNTTDSCFFKSDMNNSSMNQDWPSTSSGSYNTNEISSTCSNSIDTGNNYDSTKNGYSYTEIEGIYDDPVMAELIMKNRIEEKELLSDFLYSNGLNEFAIPPVDGKVGVREPTIDQEFEQYFSSLML